MAVGVQLPRLLQTKWPRLNSAWILQDPQCFLPPPRLPAEMAQRSLNWVLQPWDEWSVVAIAVDVVIVVVVVDVGDIRIAKSRCAPCHRTSQLSCVFPHRCNTPFWEVRKKLKNIGSHWQ